ncbi:MAG: non-canonical purine NTP pyrophosphatase, RdgB/HAM1 family [Bacteroidetes bacterium RIFCSPLOWO2_12_FULL_37_12]|nr:MAG: non-canonical purine NTP pyrophosphatase, RdgB/HAM1 family [Bacteroidetes bacterium RIFCSPLOWO2_12_FULL_37_12]
MTIYLATNNAHKLKEITPLFPGHLILKTINDLGFTGDLPETGKTLEENAKQKAKIIWNKYKVPCFADDTGLEVYALGGEPGVYSARYAGRHCSAEDNVSLLLKKLESKTNRNARFRTVIALFLDGEQYFFEGKINGKISEIRKGIGGFGYDPVFIPEGYETTFAEMEFEEKNKISHRAKAVRALVEFLTFQKIQVLPKSFL